MRLSCNQKTLRGFGLGKGRVFCCYGWTCLGGCWFGCLVVGDCYWF